MAGLVGMAGKVGAMGQGGKGTRNAMGRADRPRSAAVERGRSTLPRGKGQGKYFGSQVSGLRSLVRVIRYGRQVRDPYPYLYQNT